MPAWYRPNPDWRDQLICPNRRCRSLTALGRRDTVYAPPHHESVRWSACGAAGRNPYRIVPRLAPDRLPRYASTASRLSHMGQCCVTWSTIRNVASANHPAWLFIGRACRRERVVSVRTGARRVTTDGQAVRQRAGYAKIGKRAGRPLPGAGRRTSGLRRRTPDPGEVAGRRSTRSGCCSHNPQRADRSDRYVKRGVFAPADTWISTDYLFWRDDDGLAGGWTRGWWCALRAGWLHRAGHQRSTHHRSTRGDSAVAGARSPRRGRR